MKAPIGFVEVGNRLPSGVRVNFFRPGLKRGIANCFETFLNPTPASLTRLNRVLAHAHHHAPLAMKTALYVQSFPPFRFPEPDQTQEVPNV